MSAVAWTHWDGAFEEAGKTDGRLSFTLPAGQFAKALASLNLDWGALLKSDPRYQEACRTGRLEWWDERGRCVVLVREGGDAHRQQVAKEPILLPEFRGPDAAAVAAKRDIPPPANPLAMAPADKPVLVGPPPPPPGVWRDDPSNARIRRETAEGLATAINTSGVGVASVAPDGNVDIVSVRQPPPDAPKGKGKKK